MESRRSLYQNPDGQAVMVEYYRKKFIYKSGYWSYNKVHALHQMWQLHQIMACIKNIRRHWCMISCSQGAPRGKKESHAFHGGWKEGPLLIASHKTRIFSMTLIDFIRWNHYIWMNRSIPKSCWRWNQSLKNHFQYAINDFGDKLIIRMGFPHRCTAQLILIRSPRSECSSNVTAKPS